MNDPEQAAIKFARIGLSLPHRNDDLPSRLLEQHITVEILEHPKGFLMRIEHDGASMTLDRNEAFDLYEKLRARLGEMPVKL